jgi:hypothetical protein
MVRVCINGVGKTKILFKQFNIIKINKTKKMILSILADFFGLYIIYLSTIASLRRYIILYVIIFLL